jgi:hypothetical protein
MKKMLSHSVPRWPDSERKLLVSRQSALHLVLGSEGRPLLEDLSEGLWTYPLDLAPTLDLIALSLRLRRMHLTLVMKSNFPRSYSDFLSSFLSFLLNCSQRGINMKIEMI